MKNARFYVALLLLLPAVQAVQAQSAPPTKALGHSELPYSGYKVTTADPGLLYYVAADFDDSKPEPRVGPADGLYASKDAGRTWQLLSSEYAFRRLMVHPQTGRLFVTVRHRWPPGYEGIRYPDAYEVLMSDDGRKWRDITGKAGYIRNVLHLFPDPDHAGQVCLSVFDMIRGLVWQSKDEDYSGWVEHASWRWDKRHDKKKW